MQKEKLQLHNLIETMKKKKNDFTLRLKTTENVEIHNIIMQQKWKLKIQLGTMKKNYMH